MTERIQKLRNQSIQAVPTITPERALLITEFYKKNALNRFSPPVERALAFRYFFENRTICINPHELIVGERGPVPKAVPTYPELTTHTIRDLVILDSRAKVPYKVDAETKRYYQEEIIPFWQGKTLREKIFNEMSPEWKDAYQAGVFTEFMEQRAPGHTVLDDKIYRNGMLDFIQRIEKNIEKLDFLNDPKAYNKREELRGMAIAAETLIIFARRHAQKAAELAAQESDPIRQVELKQIEAVCLHVPAHAPRTFWEALQYYWFVHLGVISELNPWDSFNPGKLDQHLYPFYQKEIKEGTLTPKKAKELLEAFWIKFNNQPAPPKVGVTAEESATYADFAQINAGGVKPDGSDAVNEISFLMMDVIKEMQLIQPSPSVQISEKTPDQFLMKVMDVIKVGLGQPSIFNTDAVVQELVRQGKSLQDARKGGTSGCVETGAFGKENYNLTGYFNLMKILEITLNNGFDPRTGQKIGLETGNPVDFKNFDELIRAFQKQVLHFIEIKIKGNHIIERLYADYMPVPFLSLLIDDCIERGQDYHDGGARYNTSYIQGVGLGSITDALSAIKYNVFDQKRFTFSELLMALKQDFEGFEKLREILLHQTPKFGNDDDYADDIMKTVFEIYYAAVEGRKNTKGGEYHIDLLPTTVHIYFGSVTNATPDGRKAGTPLSEGISPVQGMDRKGPTAVIKSVSKMDHIRTGGTLLNMKFSPQIFNSSEGEIKVAQLIRTHFKLMGHHVQFNVVTAEKLRDAQKNPDKYRNLIVRVAGYSDYFVDLGKNLQEEIIRRTEHLEV